jgi:hypothetical protein
MVHFCCVVKLRLNFPLGDDLLINFPFSDEYGDIIAPFVGMS